MTVKLASALPKDDKNGLAAIAGDLANRYYQGGRTTAIVVLESLGVNHEDGDQIPKVGVLRIEPVSGTFEDDALDLLQTATEQRLGKKPDTLNLSGDDEFADVEPAPVLEIEAGIEDAEIVDDSDAPAPVTPLSPLSPLSPVGGDAA